ncbi:MAG: 23S rRNA (adenine(2030)-N(6))-methyltransferase RlmJ [Thiolinea sp.]
MLSYRHAFHAGNHADVLKHAVLSEVLSSFRRKDKPFIYLDTHAGGGRYDLQGAWAQKTAEAKQGIARLWQQKNAWPELADYFSCLQQHNPSGQLRHYPGSPEIARQLLRPQDRLQLLELHGNEFERLQQQVGRDKRVQLQQRDGFSGLPSLLPPTPRRGLVLIDPSYEQDSDYQQVVKSVEQGFRRWATGTYLIWYPLLGRHAQGSATLLRQLARGPYPDLLRVELQVEAAHPETGLYGSGLVLINTPWQLDEYLRKLLPRLSQALAQDAGADWRVEWLREPQ